MTRMARRAWLAGVAVALMVKAGLAFGPGGIAPPGPPGPPGAPGPPGPPAAPSGPAEVGLKIVRESDVTPAGKQCVRPGLVAAGGRLFVAYIELGSPQTNRLMELDADLKPGRVFPVAAAVGAPTDMRWVGAADGTLWCAFETALGDGRPTSTALYLAAYRVAAAGLETVLPAQRIADGAVLVPPWSIPLPGSEITNDPTPFLYGESVVLGTRRFNQAALPLRSFRAGGEKQASFDLDLGKTFPDRSLSVYSLVSIGGKPWLLAGAESYPRGAPPESDIFAVPLQPDLRGPAGAAVPLVATPAFDTYVSGARSWGGRLALVHSVNDFPTGRFEGHLRVFDTTKSFVPVGNARVMATSGGQQRDSLLRDGHLSVELLGDRIFVAFYTDRGRLIVREYAVDAP